MTYYQSSAHLGVKHKVGEVVLLGFDVEVVMSDAVPLVVEKANECNNEAKWQANAETGESDDLKSI